MKKTNQELIKIIEKLTAEKSYFEQVYLQEARNNQHHIMQRLRRENNAKVFMKTMKICVNMFFATCLIYSGITIFSFAALLNSAPLFIFFAANIVAAFVFAHKGFKIEEGSHVSS